MERKKVLVSDAIRQGRARLLAAGVDSPWLDSEILLSEAMGWTREDLLAENKQEIPHEVAPIWEGYLLRRERREPIDRILGWRAFRHFRFRVVPGVFSPRPETEELVQRAIPKVPDKGVVLDLCCAGGCVGISLAYETEARVVMVDCDNLAVQHAKEEVARLIPEYGVKVLQSDLYNEVSGIFDVITANPPYIGEEEKESLPPEVALFDPPLALFAPDEPLSVAQCIVSDAPLHLREGGWLLMEVGFFLGEEALTLFGKGWSRARLRKPWGSPDHYPYLVVEAQWTGT
ncbi:peptide chain release factor N(5)-glutamine methyltransferase [bacterium]|nr:peptide chain release factor N(5)-glutamine methyltransferase [bacterium]